MKRYLLFVYFNGWAQDGESTAIGGWHDFAGSFDTLEDCQNAAPMTDETLPQSAHIVDLETGAIVLEGEKEWHDEGWLWRKS